MKSFVNRLCRRIGSCASDEPARRGNGGYADPREHRNYAVATPPRLCGVIDIIWIAHLIETLRCKYYRTDLLHRARKSCNSYALAAKDHVLIFVRLYCAQHICFRRRPAFHITETAFASRYRSNC
eukprot:6209978-Pleurochrysis_carterae.AAC.2